MCVYGVLTHDGRQLFRIHNKFNSKQFVSFLQKVYQKFSKVLIAMDKTTPHKSKMVEQYVSDNLDIRRVHAN